MVSGGVFLCRKLLDKRAEREKKEAVKAFFGGVIYREERKPVEFSGRMWYNGSGYRGVKPWKNKRFLFAADVTAGKETCPNRDGV